MKLKTFIFLLLFLPSVIYAGERNNISFSISPYLNGGVIGVKNFAYSTLAYNGPLAGASLSLTANSSKFDSFIDTSYSIGWLGNRYHRDPASMLNSQFDLSVGGMTGLFCNSIVFVKAGGALGFMQNAYYNGPLSRVHNTFALDAKLCLSAQLMLQKRIFVLIEERIPFVSFFWAFDKYKDNVPTITPDHSWKAFPGNSLKVGIGHTLKDGNDLLLVLRHYCFSTGYTLPNRFQVQLLELGIAFRFGLTKH